MIQEYRNGLVGNILAGDFGVSLVENFHLGAITVLLASCRVVRIRHVTADNFHAIQARRNLTHLRDSYRDNHIYTSTTLTVGTRHFFAFFSLHNGFSISGPLGCII